MTGLVTRFSNFRMPAFVKIVDDQSSPFDEKHVQMPLNSEHQRSGKFRTALQLSFSSLLRPLLESWVAVPEHRSGAWRCNALLFYKNGKILSYINLLALLHLYFSSFFFKREPSRFYRFVFFFFFSQRRPLCSNYLKKSVFATKSQF